MQKLLYTLKLFIHLNSLRFIILLSASLGYPHQQRTLHEIPFNLETREEIVGPSTFEISINPLSRTWRIFLSVATNHLTPEPRSNTVLVSALSSFWTSRGTHHQKWVCNSWTVCLLSLKSTSIDSLSHDELVKVCLSLIQGERSDFMSPFMIVNHCSD